MRISISGASNTGKTTLINAFRQRWGTYEIPKTSYRDALKDYSLTHSSNTTEDTQLIILDWMLQEQKKHGKDSKIIYDRCTWDNLVYTLQANAENKVSDEVAAAVISLVRESMKDLDIIFWLPFNSNIKVIPNGIRDIDPEYLKATNQTFSDLFDHYSNNLESDIFYPVEDCPAIVKVEGDTVDDRMFYISQFLDRGGELIVEEKSILDPQNINLLEDMLQQQVQAQKSEENLMKFKEEISRMK